MSEFSFRDKVTQPIMMHGVTVSQAAQRILAENAYHDWTVEADTHPLFNFKMVTCIIDGQSMLEAFMQLANFYNAQVIVNNNTKTITYLPHPPYMVTGDSLPDFDFQD